MLSPLQGRPRARRAAAFLVLLGDGRPRAAHRLRERGQPDPGPPARAQPRAGHPLRPRRGPGAPAAAAPDREHDRGPGRRGAGPGPGLRRARGPHHLRRPSHSARGRGADRRLRPPVHARASRCSRASWPARCPACPARERIAQTLLSENGRSTGDRRRHRLRAASWPGSSPCPSCSSSAPRSRCAPSRTCGTWTPASTASTCSPRVSS